MKYRIRAWGSEEHPDLDIEVDEVPAWLGFKYPYVDIAALHPAPLPRWPTFFE